MGAVRWKLLPTSWGWMGLAATKKGWRASTLPYPEPEEALRALARVLPQGALAEEASLALMPPWEEALKAYFAGERVDFREAPLDWEGATPFQRAVWAACRGIGYGEVLTYGELARRIGHPGAARAVGQALGANPLPILVPCHRVVGQGGQLVGFGGGLEWKARLLHLEGLKVEGREDGLCEPSWCVGWAMRLP